MCKKGIFVTCKSEKGRLENIRVEIDKNGESKIVGTFTGSNSSEARKASIDEINPAHNKAKKALVGELQKISAKISKLERAGAKLSPA